MIKNQWQNLTTDLNRLSLSNLPEPGTSLGQGINKHVLIVYLCKSGDVMNQKTRTCNCSKGFLRKALYTEAGK